VKPQKWIRPPLTAGTTAAQAFVANLAAAAEQIGANAPGLLKSRNPEYLHQLRIGIRRMRSTLRAFRGLAQRRRSSAFDTELRSTLRILGQARDWDAFGESDVPAPLRQAARRSRARALNEARAAVLHRRFQSLPGRVLRWTRTKPWRKSADPQELIGSFGARALKRLHSDLSACAKGIDWADGERRHRLRIRAKRLRYGLDCFVSGFAPASVERFAHRLHALQEVLGELNDCRVQRALLRKLAPQGPAQAASGTESRLASRERRLIGKAREAWSKLEKHPQHWRREAARVQG
jgi:CHAD domain-containing protein